MFTFLECHDRGLAIAHNVVFRHRRSRRTAHHIHGHGRLHAPGLSTICAHLRGKQYRENRTNVRKCHRVMDLLDANNDDSFDDYDHRYGIGIFPLACERAAGVHAMRVTI